ncbi:SLBB domain-containing protein [Sphingomonas sp. PsM26]|nr:SLBB domain-containing protein [Sphingomonas sp. PsM26]
MAISKERVATAWRWQALLAAAAIPLAPVGAQSLGVSATNQTGTASDSATSAATIQTQTLQSQRPYRPEDSRYRSDEIRVSGQRTSDEGDAEQSASETRNRTNARLAVPNEFETFASEVADKPIRRFGANLLVPSARDFTAPPNTTVPEDYKINAGDRLVIGLTGSAEADNLPVTVDSEGRIFIPRVGAVRVGGLRYGDLQSAISAQVSRVYRNFRLSVSVERLHGITVYVTGFSTTPGSYTISSLSTLVNAVLAAGGPSAGGSFRSIQLRRNGRLISDFDLYDFLLKGDKSADAVLQNGDVIYIAPVGAIGSVNNEAIFEARPNDTLTTVLLYAGGVNTVGDTGRLLALDPLDLKAGWRQLTPTEANSQIASRALILRVLSDLGIARPLSSQNVLVTLGGEVVRPGRYFVPAGTPLSAAIAQAGGLTPNAYAFAAEFKREALRQQQRQSYDRVMQDVEFLLSATPLTSALSTSSELDRTSQLRTLIDRLGLQRPDGRLVLDVDPETTTLPDGLVLQNNDAVYIPARPVAVGVFGSVASPASFQFRTGSTVSDYVAQAGGVQKIGDRGHIFVIHANGSSVGSGHHKGGGKVLNQRILPGDLIYVPINPARGEFWRKLSALTSGLVGLAPLALLAK